MGRGGRDGGVEGEDEGGRDFGQEGKTSELKMRASY